MLQVLFLAWKTGAQQMGFFSRSEFAQGLFGLQMNALSVRQPKHTMTGIQVCNF